MAGVRGFRASPEIRVRACLRVEKLRASYHPNWGVYGRVGLTRLWAF